MEPFGHLDTAYEGPEDEENRVLPPNRAIPSFFDADVDNMADREDDEDEENPPNPSGVRNFFSEGQPEGSCGRDVLEKLNQRMNRKIFEGPQRRIRNTFEGSRPEKETGKGYVVEEYQSPEGSDAETDLFVLDDLIPVEDDEVIPYTFLKADFRPLQPWADEGPEGPDIIDDLNDEYTGAFKCPMAHHWGEYWLSSKKTSCPGCNQTMISRKENAPKAVWDIKMDRKTADNEPSKLKRTKGGEGYRIKQFDAQRTFETKARIVDVACHTHRVYVLFELLTLRAGLKVSTAIQQVLTPFSFDTKKTEWTNYQKALRASYNKTAPKDMKDWDEEETARWDQIMKEVADYNSNFMEVSEEEDSQGLFESSTSSSDEDEKSEGEDDDDEEEEEDYPGDPYSGEAEVSDTEDNASYWRSFFAKYGWDYRKDVFVYARSFMYIARKQYPEYVEHSSGHNKNATIIAILSAIFTSKDPFTTARSIEDSQPHVLGIEDGERALQLLAEIREGESINPVDHVLESLASIRAEGKLGPINENSQKAIWFLESKDLREKEAAKAAARRKAHEETTKRNKQQSGVERKKESRAQETGEKDRDDKRRSQNKNSQRDSAAKGSGAMSAGEGELFASEEDAAAFFASIKQQWDARGL